MPRARTGTLVPPGADGLWRARVTTTREDGSNWRPLYSLGTTDKALARRALIKLVAALEAGRDLPAAVSAATSVIRVREYAETWLERRTRIGVGMVYKERRNLEMYAWASIGHLPLGDVRPSHVRSLLDEAIAQGRRRATVAHIHGVLRRMFSAAVADELIEQSPVAAVRVPKMRSIRKERVILTDTEFAQFIGCAEVDLELRMLSLAARCEGGMRTGDLHRWDWSQIDCSAFAECIVPRAKTGAPQTLAIPAALAPFLRAWWQRAGEPRRGPVFPARTGKRAGQAKRPLTSYAKRLRRGLLQAGIVRRTPREVPATKSGTRTDLGRQASGTKLAPDPSDPLYFETETTLPVDFHSFRRAFASALAEAGVNVQHAMHLTAHSDPRVHARYVMRTTAMRSIPEAAIPRLPAGGFAPVAATPHDALERARAVGIVTVRDDSALEAPEALGASTPSAPGPWAISAPAAGLEPATRRLTAACSTD